MQASLWRQAKAIGGRPLDIAEADGGGEGGDFVVAAGDEFLPDKAGVAAFGDGAHEGRVVDFLLVVEFTAAGIAGGVEVADEFRAALKMAQEIAVHDLDVVKVEEDFHAGGADRLTNI